MPSIYVDIVKRGRKTYVQRSVADTRCCCEVKVKRKEKEVKGRKMGRAGRLIVPVSFTLDVCVAVLS